MTDATWSKAVLLVERERVQEIAAARPERLNKEWLRKDPGDTQRPEQTSDRVGGAEMLAWLDRFQLALPNARDHANDLAWLRAAIKHQLAELNEGPSLERIITDLRNLGTGDHVSCVCGASVASLLV